MTSPRKIHGLLHEEPVDGSTTRNRSQSRSIAVPVSLAIKIQKSAVGPLSVARRTEKDDAYGAVVARLNRGWRIIECRDGVQRILQRRKGQSSDRPEWRGRSFCRTRSGLLICIRENCGPIDAGALTVMEHLPKRLGD